MFAKKFFKDKLVLLFLFINLALALLTILLIILHIDLSQTKVTFRQWLVDGNSQLYTTDPTYFYILAGAAGFFFLSSCVISYKIYDFLEPGAYFSLILGQIVLLANLLISEILLNLG